MENPTNRIFSAVSKNFFVQNAAVRSSASAFHTHRAQLILRAAPCASYNNVVNSLEKRRVRTLDHIFDQFLACFIGNGNSDLVANGFDLHQHRRGVTAQRARDGQFGQLLDKGVIIPLARSCPRRKCRIWAFRAVCRRCRGLDRRPRGGCCRRRAFHLRDRSAHLMCCRH